MNICLLRIYSVPIGISSLELNVSDTCFYMNLHIVERYVTTTFVLFALVLLETLLLELKFF